MIINELQIEMMKLREAGKNDEFRLIARARATICRLTLAVRVDDPEFTAKSLIDMEAAGLFVYADEVIGQSGRTIRKFGV